MSEPVEQSLPSEQNTAVAEAIDTALILRIFEASLMTSQEPLSATQLKRMVEVPLETRQVEELMQKLADKYADSGIELNRVASGWRFRARPELQLHLDKLDPQKPPRYSRAVLETLAIIAYRQPVTRGDIEEIRGVQVASQIIKTLEARGWVEVVGVRDVPGRPELLGTTARLLDDLGLRSLAELPPLQELSGLLEPAGADE
jgi:segregation and condensation protein B